jgi:hypothetical protein
MWMRIHKVISSKPGVKHTIICIGDKFNQTRNLADQLFGLFAEDLMTEKWFLTKYPNKNYAATVAIFEQSLTTETAALNGAIKDLAFYNRVIARFNVEVAAYVNAHFQIEPLMECPPHVDIISVRPNVSQYDQVYYHEGV